MIESALKSAPFALIAPSATPEEIHAALDERSFPLVDHERVTFAYFGEAEKVELRHWVYGLPSCIPLSRVGDTDLWYCVMEFPRESRIEYKFGVVNNGHEEWILDPLNRNVATDPFGGNSVVHCEGYEVPSWSQHDPLTPQGRIEELEVQSDAFAESRQVKVYLPHNFRDYRRYRLLVVHDGDDYLRFSQLGAVLDNLIAAIEVAPLVVALTNPHQRIPEYTNNPDHARFLVEELLPAMEERYPLISAPAARCLMGASLGGVASLSTAYRYPDAFGSLLLQSGSFAFSDIGPGPENTVFERVVDFMNLFRRDPGNPADRAFVSCGVYEPLIYENRSLVPLLQAHGIEVKYEESKDGHNWENWRDRLRSALTWLFPGPLWVTYE